MQLSEVFTQLTCGELSQLSIGGAEAGEINDTNWDKVIPHVNLGLTALYKRFALKEGRITLALQSGKYTYTLSTLYAASNVKSKQAVKYILDAASPFLDDILKLEAAYSDSGYDFGLNDGANPYSIMTPSVNTIRVPKDVVAKSVDLLDQYKTSNLELVYRANHPKIVVGNGWFDPESYEIELPDSHLEALLFFVASRFNNPIGMVNEFNAGNNYASKYEFACKQLETAGLEIDQGNQSERLHRNGWV